MGPYLRESKYDNLKFIRNSSEDEDVTPSLMIDGKENSADLNTDEVSNYNAASCESLLTDNDVAEEDNNQVNIDDILENLTVEWDKADQEYLGLLDNKQDPEQLTMLELMLHEDFWNLDMEFDQEMYQGDKEDEGEENGSRESGVFDLVDVNENTDNNNNRKLRSLSKEEIETEFYELLQNMMHELNQVKCPTSPQSIRDYYSNRYNNNLP